MLAASSAVMQSVALSDPASPSVVIVCSHCPLTTRAPANRNPEDRVSPQRTVPKSICLETLECMHRSLPRIARTSGLLSEYERFCLVVAPHRPGPTGPLPGSDRVRSQISRGRDVPVPRALEEIACANLVSTEPTSGAPVARPGGVENYRSHIQDATTKQHAKSGLPSKLPAADQEAAFAGGPHPVQPILFIAQGQSSVRCRPPSTPELPLELGCDRDPVRVDLRAPIACLKVKSDVGQRTNDDVEGEWTDEITGLKSHPHGTVSPRGLRDCGLHVWHRVRHRHRALCPACRSPKLDRGPRGIANRCKST